MTNIEKVLIFEDYANSKPIVPKKKHFPSRQKNLKFFAMFGYMRACLFL